MIGRCRVEGCPVVVALKALTRPRIPLRLSQGGPLTWRIQSPPSKVISLRETCLPQEEADVYFAVFDGQISRKERNYMTQFYVYVYQDPRKPGQFQYGKYKFSFQPIYVGKGKGRRYRSHLACNDPRNKLKNKRFIDILAADLIPICDFVLRCDDEIEAYRMETEVITTIGRFPRGPLLNLTDGGTGTGSGEGSPRFGMKHSEATKALLSYHASHRSPETRRRMAEARRGILHTAEAKEKISIAMAGTRNPFFGKTHSDATRQKMKGRVVSEEAKQALRELYLGTHLRAEHRQHIRDAAPRGSEHYAWGKYKNREEVTRAAAKKARYRLVIRKGAETFITYSLKLFCVQYDLDERALNRSLIGKYAHKGYRLVAKDPLDMEWYRDEALYQEFLEVSDYRHFVSRQTLKRRVVKITPP